MNRILVSPSPHIHAKTSTSVLMRDVVIALLPSVIVSVLYYGWAALALLAVSVVSCILVEYLITRFMFKAPGTIGDWSSSVTGVLLFLNLPPSCPWWVAIIGAIFAIGVVKMTFGGLGQNLFNPAIAARVFLLVSFPTFMTDWAAPSGFLGVDAVSGATPLGIVKEGLAQGLTLPEIYAQHDFSYLQTLFINIGGSAGEISALSIFLHVKSSDHILRCRFWLPCSCFPGYSGLSTLTSIPTRFSTFSPEVSFSVQYSWPPTM